MSFNLHITSFSDRSKVVEKYIDANGYPAKSTGFKTLDRLYTHKDSGITDWTGNPTSGKTYFVLDLMFHLAERYGHVNALYVPDLGSYVEIVGKLIKMYTGKNIHPKYGNRATMDDLLKSIPFLSKHFIILERKNIRETITPEKIWEFCCDNKEINNVLIDSWKNLYHDMKGKREDQYLDYLLSYRNELAENYNKHFHTIAHSVKTELEDSMGSDGQRKRRVPTAYDIKGGGSWYANGKNIITVDRPDKTTNAVDLHVWKTKPEDVGQQGALINEIFLDRERGRYYELVDGTRENPYDYIKFSKIANPDFDKVKPNPLEPNINFENVFENDDQPF